MNNLDINKFNKICAAKAESLCAVMSDAFDTAIEKYNVDDVEPEGNAGTGIDLATNSIEQDFLSRIENLEHFSATS